MVVIWDWKFNTLLLFSGIYLLLFHFPSMSKMTAAAMLMPSIENAMFSVHLRWSYVILSFFHLEF